MFCFCVHQNLRQFLVLQFHLTFDLRSDKVWLLPCFLIILIGYYKKSLRNSQRKSMIFNVSYSKWLLFYYKMITAYHYCVQTYYREELLDSTHWLVYRQYVNNISILIDEKDKSLICILAAVSHFNFRFVNLVRNEIVHSDGAVSHRFVKMGF